MSFQTHARSAAGFLYRVAYDPALNLPLEQMQREMAAIAAGDATIAAGDAATAAGDATTAGVLPSARVISAMEETCPIFASTQSRPPAGCT